MAASRRMAAGIPSGWFETRENALLTMRERSPDRILNDEFEGSAVPLDVAGVKVSADNQRRGIGKAREQFVPRHGRLSGIGIGGR